MKSFTPQGDMQDNDINNSSNNSNDNEGDRQQKAQSTATETTATVAITVHGSGTECSPCREFLPTTMSHPVSARLAVVPPNSLDLSSPVIHHR